VLALGATLLTVGSPSVKRPVPSSRMVQIESTPRAIVEPTRHAEQVSAPVFANAPVVIATEAEAQPKAPLTVEEHRALDRRREEQVIAQFEADQVPTTDSWHMRRQLQEVFEAFRKDGVVVEEVDCKFRLCRTQLLFNDVAADISILKTLFLNRTSPEINSFGQAIVPTREYLPNGKVRATMYIAREGEIEVFD